MYLLITMDPSTRSTPRNRNAVRLQLQGIISGMRVGDRLPSERELSGQWEIARMTVRRALDELFKEGAIERRHGSGTYVAPRPFVRALGLTSFSEDMRNRGLVPGSKLISFTPGIADAVVQKGFTCRWALRFTSSPDSAWQQVSHWL